MRLLVDLTSLKTNRGGVKRYVLGLLKILQDLSDGIEVATAAAPVPPYRDQEGPVPKILRHLLLLAWFQVCLPIIACFRRADLILCPEYYCPRWASCPRVVVFHDTLFWDRPEYPVWWRKLLAVNALGPARRQRMVVAPSRSVAQQVARVLGRDPAAIAVLPPLGAELDRSVGGDRRIRALGLNSAFLLHVGAMERRKAIPMLIRAYGVARGGREAWPPLVIAGPRSPIAALDDYENILTTIQKQGLQDCVRVLGEVEEELLSELYSTAVALVFASRSEGFGIPLVEAMSVGLPLVAVDSAVTREVTGGAALTAPADDQDALAMAIRTVVQDEHLRSSLSHIGLLRARDFGRAEIGARLRQICASATS